MSSGICRLFSSLTVRSFNLRMRGLSNYHLSCCVNSLLQSLAATWELSDLLDRWDASSVIVDGCNVPLQLKRLLAVMRGDLHQPASHRHFLHCLDRNRLRLGAQHDADEVFLSILNLTQQQMDHEGLAEEIQDLFRISVETVLQCLDCTSVQTRSSYLLSLPLHIREDHDSLEACLASFFEHQELSGINCCFCTQCGRKTPSQQGVRLLALPRILCVHLKRFRNVRSSTKKLECRVSFPETFFFSQVVGDVFSPDFSQDNCRYTLYAVVVHSGVAACGHYTAYVRHTLNNRWYHADDSNVQEASWEEVQTTYGGKARDTAYMLMYRKGSAGSVQQPPELS